jgi:hypothetical protein
MKEELEEGLPFSARTFTNFLYLSRRYFNKEGAYVLRKQDDEEGFLCEFFLKKKNFFIS